MSTETDEQHKLAAAMAFLRRVANPPEGLDPIEAIGRELDRWWAVALLAEFKRLHAMEGRTQGLMGMAVTNEAGRGRFHACRSILGEEP